MDAAAVDLDLALILLNLSLPVGLDVAPTAK
jgi:hypothetical protein